VEKEGALLPGQTAYACKKTRRSAKSMMGKPHCTIEYIAKICKNRKTNFNCDRGQIKHGKDKRNGEKQRFDVRIICFNAQKISFLLQRI